MHSLPTFVSHCNPQRFPHGLCTPHRLISTNPPALPGLLSMIPLVLNNSKPPAQFFIAALFRAAFTACLRRRADSALLLTLLALANPVAAQIPQMMSYQGRVAVGGVNFTGTGLFKFALVNGAYGGFPGETAIYWSNDGSLATVNAAGVPTASVSLSCDKGLYSVLLGNPSSGMVPLTASAFGGSDVRLRVWFSDGVNGFQLLTPDQRIASVAFAMFATHATSIPDGSVNSLKLADGAVTAGKLANNSVTAGTLVDGSITTSKLGFASVNTDKILDGSIATADLQDGAVATADLAAGAVTGAKIANLTVTAANLADATITAGKLATGSVTTTQLLDGTVATADLADLNVTAAKIADATITSAKLATGSVTTTQILDGTVATGDLATGAVTTAKIATGAVGTNELTNLGVVTADLADLSVTNAKLAAGSVTSAKIAPLAVGTTELADLAVTTAKLADTSVTTAKIAAGAITSNEIATATIQNIDLAYNVINTGEIIDGAVQTADLANLAVTTAKVAAAAIGTTQLQDSSVTTAKLATLPAVAVSLAASIEYAPAGAYESGFYAVTWDTEKHDTSNMFRPGDPYHFFAPVKGIYRYSCNLEIYGGIYAKGTAFLIKNDGNLASSLTSWNIPEVGNDPTATGSFEVLLNANDTLKLVVALDRINELTNPMGLSASNKRCYSSLSLVTPVP